MLDWVQPINQLFKGLKSIMADIAALKASLLEVKAGVDSLKDTVIIETTELKALAEAQSIKASNLIAKIEELKAILASGSNVDLSEVSAIAEELKVDVASVSDSITKISDAVAAVPSPSLPPA